MSADFPCQIPHINHPALSLSAQSGCPSMTPHDLRNWRANLNLTQQQAADLLGVSVTTVELYERGVRRDSNKPVPIPRYIELACATLNLEIAADRNNVALLAPAVRAHAQHVSYLLSLPSFEATNGSKGKSWPTMHASLRDKGLIPRDEPSLLERLFPLADASKLRRLMFEIDVNNSESSASA
jgi:transcriptional regulator with XRE-family HTH domain